VDVFGNIYVASDTTAGRFPPDGDDIVKKHRRLAGHLREGSEQCSIEAHRERSATHSRLLQPGPARIVGTFTRQQRSCGWIQRRSSAQRATGPFPRFRIVERRTGVFQRLAKTKRVAGSPCAPCSSPKSQALRVPALTTKRRGGVGGKDCGQPCRSQFYASPRLASFFESSTPPEYGLNGLERFIAAYTASQDLPAHHAHHAPARRSQALYAALDSGFGRKFHFN